MLRPTSSIRKSSDCIEVWACALCYFVFRALHNSSLTSCSSNAHLKSYRRAFFLLPCSLLILKLNPWKSVCAKLNTVQCSRCCCFFLHVKPYKAKKKKKILYLKAAVLICFSVCVWFSRIQDFSFFCLKVFFFHCFMKFLVKI